MDTVYVVISIEKRSKDYRVESVHQEREGAQKACNELYSNGISATWYQRDVTV